MDGLQGLDSGLQNFIQAETERQRFQVGIWTRDAPDNRDAPDIRPDNPAFFDIWYPAGHQIALPDTGIR
jgi:hypothetical protein